MSVMYTCGIIEESLDDPRILSKLSNYLHTSRVEKLPDEEPDIWHVYEYHVAEADLERFIPELQHSIKEGWYIHAFNIMKRKLYVILKGKCFLLPTEKDDSWNEMISYGESVGCDRRWTANIPLRV
jgi:hypothetical protein